MVGNNTMKSAAMGVRKGTWTEEEDRRLKKCVERYGEGKWHLVPRRAGLNRCRKSCRLRWLNYLKPDLKRGEFQEDEIDLITRLHKLLGNRWSLIAGRLPGRTANDVKNFWNTHMVKKIDHHKPKEHEEPQNLVRVDIIRPQPRTFTKSWAWLTGTATLLVPTPYSSLPANDMGQPSPIMLSCQVNESAWWENLFTNNNQHRGVSTSRSGSERHSNVENPYPWNIAMEENPNGWNNLTLDGDIWELLGLGPHQTIN